MICRQRLKARESGLLSAFRRTVSNQLNFNRHPPNTRSSPVQEFIKSNLLKENCRRAFDYGTGAEAQRLLYQTRD
jgi:hypothetical protein